LSTRLAIVCSHPIQYYSPWFRHLSACAELELKVFFLWDFGIKPTWDPDFQKTISWDVSLLDGFPHTFVPNTSNNPGTHHFNGLQNPSLLAELLAWKPDAVLTFGYNYASLLRLLLTLPQRIPLLLRGDSHRLGVKPTFKAFLKNSLTTLLFRRYRAFLYCGQANKDYFLHRGVKPKQLFFTPHAIDMEHFQKIPSVQEKAQAWRNSLNIAETDTLILFAGKLEEKKRPNDLLESFLNLQQPQRHLVFVGSGLQEESLKQKAAPYSTIHFLPFHNQSKMPTVYTAADLFVLPSFGSGETWGLAVQEALACGTPVVVSDHVGCHSDLIEGKTNGLVFQAGSRLSLTEALEKALLPNQLKAWAPQTRASLENHTYAQATEGLLVALEFIKK